ncbi:MAG: Flagellar hook-associated protein FlgL [uncultured Caballeronia sp.]|nr:MAG: Flagellar hook-associated protein FlgL [uncultured Caballeronia sp.]
MNRVASQTTYNGKNVLDGSAGNVSFQIGANVGQTISLNLTQSLSAASTALFMVTAGTGIGATQTGSSIVFTAGGALGATAPTGYGTVNSVAGNYGISTANTLNTPPTVVGVNVTSARRQARTLQWN